ncbi:MAG: 30S ribosome-binding factor RbfA [Bosea sp. (in: a-proteobacteria)]
MAKPASRTPKGPTQRQLRVGELIRHEVAAILTRGEIHDPVLAKYVISVTQVRLSPDLKLATCYIMPLGGMDEKPIIAALDSHKKVLRSEIARRVNLKFSPELRFRRDEAFDEGLRIDRLLYSEKVQRDLRKPVAEDEDEA